MQKLKEWFFVRWNRVDWPDVGVRALKTGLQVAIAMGALDALTSRNWPGVWTALVAGGSAAVSVVWNAVRQAFTA